MCVTLADIEAARRRIADHVYCSPCPESLALSDMTGSRIFCKLDNLQRTGSFKERGACNALMQLPDDARKRGVTAASAGNHALALAYHGRQLGIAVTVVMPTNAPLIKVATCRRMGATIVQLGDSFAAARAQADLLVTERGLTYIHGFDDPHIIAGQGTVGLEILEQVPNVDAVIVATGGAGLLAGTATAIKAIRPGVKVIAVEPAAMPSLSAALKAGQPVAVPPCPTLADGLAVGRVGAAAFELAKDRIDKVVTVDEATIALAILRMIEREKTVVEGAGAATLAALMSGQLEELRGKNVVLVIGGGNIDPTVLGRIIEYGLVADGRLCRFTAMISDRPGGLAKFTSALATTGASVKEVVHDRAFAGPDVSMVRLSCVVETHDHAHRQAMLRMLCDNGFVVTV